ncbi:MAG: hypothetical protein K8R77_15235 [Anaerolineaceae bacterium]|nr:hypothetical protein [Anaerolineaceae bacterium]
MLDGFFDRLQHNWDYIVRSIVPKNWTWSFPVIIPGGYGITDEIIEHSVSIRAFGYGFGDTLVPVFAGVGFIITCIPAQVENIQYGDTSFADITGDIAVDALGFGLSELVGYGVGGLAIEAPPVALGVKVVADVIVGMAYNYAVDQTGFRETVVDQIELIFNKE